MKKHFLGWILLLALIISLSACGGKNERDENTLKVGVSPMPHAEILEQAKPILKDQGIELEIVKFDDYILPNKALAEGEIDANYFQHVPYFNLQVEENNYDFTNAGGVHIEPMGLYSQKIKDIKELPDGATIIASNSASDWGRIITILQDAGLITVKKGVELETATFEDIADNPKNLRFVTNVNPELLATAYQNNEGDLVAINANFAYTIGLNPLKDAILLEKDNSPYVNIIAVQSKDKDNKKIKKLMEALHDKNVQEWVLENWEGSVKPVDN